MRTTIIVAAAWTMLSLCCATDASAQHRFDVGLLLGSTQVTDQGGAGIGGCRDPLLTHIKVPVPSGLLQAVDTIDRNI